MNDDPELASYLRIEERELERTSTPENDAGGRARQPLTEPVKTAVLPMGPHRGSALQRHARRSYPSPSRPCCQQCCAAWRRSLGPMGARYTAATMPRTTAHQKNRQLRKPTAKTQFVDRNTLGPSAPLEVSRLLPLEDSSKSQEERADGNHV